jgi:hypothetical protein
VAGTDASVVTAVASARGTPRIVGGTYSGASDDDTDDQQTVFLGFRPKRVKVYGTLQCSPTAAGPYPQGYAESIPENGTRGFYSIGIGGDPLTTDLHLIPEPLSYGFRVWQSGAGTGTLSGLNLVAAGPTPQPYDFVAYA